MVRNPDPRRCQVPGCRAFAMRSSDPPRCAAHSGRTGGAPRWNQYRRTHRFHCQVAEADELVECAARRGSHGAG
jgi:hypothetical protein